MAGLTDITKNGTQYELMPRSTAGQFSTSTAYAVGDYCYFDGTLYRCTTAHAAGAFVASHFTAVTIDGELKAKEAEIENVKSDLRKAGLSDEAKEALLACFRNVAWINDQGQTYYDALEEALSAESGKTLLSITAVFNQGQNVIYTDDSLDTLKQYLPVTAPYDDNTDAVVTTYALSGNLVDGTNTITVSYGGKTTTFNAVAVDFYNIHEWSESNGLAISKGNIVTEYTTMIVSNETATNRGMAYCGRGKKDIYKYNNGDPVSFDPKKYPIPMPVGTKRVTMTYTGLFLANINLYKYNDNTDTYTWNGQPTYTIRVNGEVSFEIDIQDENNFVLPLFLLGTNGSLPTDVNLTFSFD